MGRQSAPSGFSPFGQLQASPSGQSRLVLQRLMQAIAGPASPRNGRHCPVGHAASQAAGEVKLRLMNGATRAIRSGDIGGSFGSSITTPPRFAGGLAGMSRLSAV